MSNFPTTLPSISNPSASDALNSPAHATIHGQVNDEVTAVATKVGVDGSAVTTTHDYKLSGVTGTDKAVSKTGTEILTNKRITKRVGTTASSATPTINTDNYDIYRITAQAAAITSFTTNLSGTPTDGQGLIISITDDGTARGITWGSSFESSTITLPTTTVSSTRLDVGLIWNTVTSKWRCVAVA